MKELIEIFFKKSFEATLISIMVALVVPVIIPNEIIDFFGGNAPFAILVFSACFLIILILNFIVQEKEKDEKLIEEINAFVDGHSPEDRRLFSDFVNNGNKIMIALPFLIVNKSTLLFNTDVIEHCQYGGSIANIDESKYWLHPSLKEAIEVSENMFDSHPDLRQYKIKDGFFHNLKVIHKKQGKLGNF